jgi:hypothetical protein
VKQRTLEGTFKEGRFVSGKMIFKDGSIYEGEYLND